MREPRPLPVSNGITTSPLHRGERQAGSPVAEPAETSRFQNALSVVMMAGIAFLPIVIAAGFLSEHLEASSVPGEVTTAALRGPIDADRHAFSDEHPLDRGSEPASVRVRAGF